MRARVFIWYGHPLFASAVTALLRREGLDIAGTEGDPAAAAAEIARLRPDVVVVDRVIERTHPAVLAEVIRACQPVRILVLDLIEDVMRVYDGSGETRAEVQTIVRAIEDTVQHLTERRHAS